MRKVLIVSLLFLFAVAAQRTPAQQEAIEQGNNRAIPLLITLKGE